MKKIKDWVLKNKYPLLMMLPLILVISVMSPIIIGIVAIFIPFYIGLVILMFGYEFWR